MSQSMPAPEADPSSFREPPSDASTLRTVGPESPAAVAPAKKRRVFGWAAVAWIVAIIAIGAAATGFVLRSNTASDLSKAKTTISTTKAELADAQSKLSTALSQMGPLKATAQLQQAATQRASACALAYRLDIQAHNGVIQPSPAVVSKWMTATLACYGKIPPWLH